jgi:hypothetical protein
MAEPLLTLLCYSAGVQSHAILRMVCDGAIQRPKRFAVIAADPGMESGVSIAFRDNEAAELCKAANIPFVVAQGPNLYRDVTTLKSTAKTRLDTPPLWTDNGDGTKGRLIQKCTDRYKIQPINRAVRRELYRTWGIPTNRKGDCALAAGSVVRWIGFTADEQGRADNLLKSKYQKFVRFEFPLIDRGMSKSDVVAMYLEKSWRIPIRSMCNACPWHGLRSFKDMHDNRPNDWIQAVAVDEAGRDLTQIGVRNPCYVSQTLIPLTELAAMSFELPGVVENDLAQCDSGVCFV